MKNTEKEQKVGITMKDLYQFLLTDCRYGYSRNNHLMPWGAYDHAKKYLPKMLKKDEEYATSTAKQLCEECISDELTANFYDGLDDENGNRREAIEFIQYLLEFVKNNDHSTKNWLPYNYHLYSDNLAREESYRYNVYSIKDFDYNSSDNYIKDTLATNLTLNEAYEFLFKVILNCKRSNYNKIEVTNDKKQIIGRKFRIIEPFAYQNELYMIKMVDDDKEGK